MSEQAKVTDSGSPRVGQVWQDWDVRYRKHDPGRRLRIDRIEGDYAYCTQVTDMSPADQQVGKRRRIKLSRLRPTSTGYKLVVGHPSPSHEGGKS